MRLFGVLFLALFALSMVVTPVSAQVTICESIQKRIKDSKAIGGEKKGNDTISQMLYAHKFLKKNIPANELILCILKAGAGSSFVRTEAISAGIAKTVVDPVIYQFEMQARALENTGDTAAVAATANVVSPDVLSETDSVTPGEDPAMPAEVADDIVAIDTIAQGTGDTAEVDSGGASGPGCSQISPWTWCAY